MTRAIVLMGTLLLGVQFCFPQAHQEAGLTSSVDEVSLRTVMHETEVDDHESFSGSGLVMPTSHGIAIHASFAALVRTGFRQVPERICASLLIPLEGLQPAAP